MTEKEFSQSLRRGLGNAIIELKNTDDKSKYRDIVLRLCLRDIAYDTQVEGTKGYYLYTAIKEFDEPEIFLNKVAEKFEKRVYWRLSEQLMDILFCFLDEDDKLAALADETLQAKYDELKQRLPLMRNYSLHYCEREQLEYLMIKKTDGGFKHFKRCINDIGEMLIKRGDSDIDCVFYDWFISNSKGKFGEKRVADYLETMSKKSAEVKAVTDALKKSENEREIARVNREEEKITVDMVIATAKESATLENPHAGMLRQVRRFMYKASEAERTELAYIALQEKDEIVKALLLCMFRYEKFRFPLEILPLFEYAWSENKLLREIAINCLERFKDKRIHDLALQLLHERGLDSFALSLFFKNYRKSDDEIIGKLVLKSSVPHHVQQDIEKLYRHHRSSDALPVLLHVYKKGDCSFCREYVVRAMQHCGVLSDEILNECLYDSYDDTRKYADRIIKNRRRKLQNGGKR